MALSFDERSTGSMASTCRLCFLGEFLGLAAVNTHRLEGFFSNAGRIGAVASVVPTDHFL